MVALLEKVHLRKKYPVRPENLASNYELFMVRCYLCLPIKLANVLLIDINVVFKLNVGYLPFSTFKNANAGVLKGL